MNPFQKIKKANSNSQTCFTCRVGHDVAPRMTSLAAGLITSPFNYNACAILGPTRDVECENAHES
jgi:hypothetical protein